MLAEGARVALSLSGTMLGFYPVKVLPSKTAILPVNPTFLPRVRSLIFYLLCQLNDYFCLALERSFLLNRFLMLETDYSRKMNGKCAQGPCTALTLTRRY